MLSITVALSVAYSAAVMLFVPPLVRLFSNSDKVTDRLGLRRLSSVFGILRYSEFLDNNASVAGKSTPQRGLIFRKAGISLHTCVNSVPCHIRLQWIVGQSSHRSARRWNDRAIRHVASVR